MKCWIALLLSCSSASVIELASFSSPLIPGHAHKFTLLGSAVSQASSVLITPFASNHTGTLAAINPITAPSFSLLVEAVDTGVSTGEEDGGFTVWLTSYDAKHIAEGTLFGVSPTIVGVLVVFDYRRGLIGVEKTQEETIDPLPLTHNCTPDLKGGNFTLMLSINRGSILSVKYQLSSDAPSPCFSMPISFAPKRFFGVSASCNKNCQRGLEVTQLQTTVEEAEDYFVWVMEEQNQLLQELIIRANVSIQETREVVLERSRRDLQKVNEVLEESKQRVKDMTRRIALLRAEMEEVLSPEDNGAPSVNYLKALSSLVPVVEAAFEEVLTITNSSRFQQVRKEAETSQFLQDMQELRTLMENLQFQMIALKQVAQGERGLSALAVGLVLLALAVIGFYFRLRKAGKAHEI